MRGFSTLGPYLPEHFTRSEELCPGSLEEGLSYVVIKEAVREAPDGADQPQGGDRPGDESSVAEGGASGLPTGVAGRAGGSVAPGSVTGAPTIDSSPTAEGNSPRWWGPSFFPWGD
jgi:hypothetical protein